MNIFTVKALVTCLTGLLLLAQGAQAQETGSIPGRVVTNVVRSAVIVEKINHDTREIKVLDASGNRFTIIADEAVNNLDQVKPRDRIVTEYMESVAIVVVPTGSPELPQGVAGGFNPEGGSPGATGIETVMISATIESINHSSRRVTITDGEGNTASFPVGDDTPLELVDVGDEVRVRLTRAVAISVEPPGA